MALIERLIPTRTVRLVGTNYVSRILPFRERRMVGPFIFLDHMPLHEIDLAAGSIARGEIDVPPHPHIGLSTLTYLFDGTITHRDSMGYVQDITAGDVNWMTAGKGTVHSERAPEQVKQLHEGSFRTSGLQAWVALPRDKEESESSFQHIDRGAVPVFEKDGATITVVAGDAFGVRNPVVTSSPLFYLHVTLKVGKSLRWQPRKNDDAAIYLLSGAIEIESKQFDQSIMVVFNRNEEIIITANTDSEFMLLGGEPLDGERHIYWNFVSSSRDAIEAAKKLWLDQRFGKIPGETEFIPLPK